MSGPTPRELAEDIGAYAPDFPGTEQIRNERWCLFLGVAPHLAFLQRLRLTADEVEATVAEVEQIAAERGHDAPSWWIGDSATPPDLAERLEALGFQHVEDLTGMALARPPRGEPALEVRPVASLDEYRRASEITWEAFEVPEEARERLRPGLAQQYEERRSHPGARLFVAYDGGRPVASATAEYLDSGVFLAGGATLPDARGRGAYTSLVHARWHDAAERGTPLLVTQARAESARVLEPLGFESLARIRLYVRA